MYLSLSQPYNVCVRAFNSIAAGRIVLALLVCELVTLAPAWADTALVDTTGSPVLNVVLKSGSLTIKTWTKSQVYVNMQGSMTSRHLNAAQVTGRLPTQVPVNGQSVKTPRGVANLPGEVFALPSLAGHDAVTIDGDGNTVVTVPTGTVLVIARVRERGTINVLNYRDGAFFANVRTGAVALRNVSGIGFIQVLRGPIVAYDSSFARLRARNATGNIFFSNCDARQIEVTSVYGNIVFDNGSLQPGLARFESQHGDVALGIASGGAQIGAHSNTGNIQTSFNGAASVSNHRTDAQVTVGTGGANVTASSRTGAILLYDGTLNDHRVLARGFPAMRNLYKRREAPGQMNLRNTAPRASSALKPRR